MKRFPILALAFAAYASPVAAQCRDIEGARDMIMAAGAIPPPAAVAAAASVASGEMIRGRVCGGGGGLIYEITFLGGDGKVSRVSVDGQSGAVIGVR